ncbi:ABC transporter substrate-binding protein [Streptomyces sp. NBC_00457]|uniref:ABC transporter substrate-binding protein n=1 Tax=unclassified Streptomyces TaxID=2593676 RepID=UPI002E1E2B27|nr:MULTISPECIES: ABC transporter substrate-binding protein [unclassified Streptomyces]
MPGNRTTMSWALALTLALSALGTGCSGGSDQATGDKTVLRYTWWGNPDRAERTEKAISLFEKQHPRIDIQTSFAGYEAYKQKLATQAAGGDAPDVMQLDYRQIDQYAQGGILLDLGTQSSVLDTSDIDPGLLATGKVDDTQYAIPQGRGTETFAYDAQQWKKAGVGLPANGWTWDDWADAVRNVSERTGKPGSVDPGQSEDVFEVWLRGQGKSLYTKDGDPGFTADDLTRFWTFTDGLRREGAVSSAEDTTQVDGTVENTPLGRGTASGDFNWDAPTAGLVPIVGDNLVLGPLPAGPSGVGQYFKPSMFMAVADSTGHPKEAAEFIDFMVNDLDAARVLGATRSIPVNDTARDTVVPELTGIDKQIADYQQSVEGELKPPPQAPPSGDSGLQTTFMRDYDQVSFGKLSPREAAENYLTEAKAELRQ